MINGAPVYWAYWLCDLWEDVVIELMLAAMISSKLPEQYLNSILSYSSVEPVIYFIIIVAFMYSLKRWRVLKLCYIAKVICVMVLYSMLLSSVCVNLLYKRLYIVWYKWALSMAKKEIMLPTKTISMLVVITVLNKGVDLTCEWSFCRNGVPYQWYEYLNMSCIAQNEI